MAGVSGRRQLKAMLRKNFLLKWRGRGQTFCELCTPIFFMFLLVIGWSVSLSDVEKTPPTIYANDTTAFTELGNLLERVLKDYDPNDPPLPGCYPIPDIEKQICFKDEDWEAVAKIMDNKGPISVPDFDDFVTAHQVLRSAIGDDYSELRRIDKLTDSTLHNLIFLGDLTFAPDSQAVKDLVQHLNETHPGFMLAFDGIYATEQEAVDAALDTDSDLNSTWGVVYFRELDLDQGMVDYTLRMNYSVLPSTKEYAPLYDLGFDSTYQKYVYSGFLSLQSMVNDAILHFTDPDNLLLLGQTEVEERASIQSRLGSLKSKGSIGVQAGASSIAAAAAVSPRGEGGRNHGGHGGGREDRKERWKQSVRKWKHWYAGEHPGADLQTMEAFLEESSHPIADLISFWLHLNLPSLRSAATNQAADSGADRAAATTGDAEEDLLGWDPITAAEEYYAVPFPTPETEKNPFYQSTGPLVGLLMCMSMLYPVSRLLKGIVQEKETRSKETMKIMGLKQWVFVASWVTTYFILFTFTAFCTALLLAVTALQRTDFFLLFIFFWLYVVSQITFAFMLQVFFDKAKLAGIVGPLVIFMAAVPRYAFFSGSPDDDIQIKGFLSFLLAPTAFSLGSDLVMQYEGANRGMNWGTLYDDAFSFGTVLTALFFNIFLYAGLAWYFEEVIPNEYGKQRKWYFLCQPSYWRRQRCWAADRTVGEDYRRIDDSMYGEAAVSGAAAPLPSEAELEEEDGVAREPVQGNFRPRVLIQNLRKVFTSGRGAGKKTTVAVHDLNLKLYEGQITALLGQNGAGKSTTISMLTGLINPTSGDALIDGKSLVNEIDDVRQSLGVCPQHNVLFDHLTCLEHLRLYATLKGLPEDRVEAECLDMLEQVGLMDKANTFSSALSGGMQRKLSVGIALVAGSQIVFLDEPTSGMDPYSRRSTWELLRQARKGRVIVLTTHFMDEADLLGDRIAIMSEGRLKCVGSSLFLKARFGIGYNLTLTRAQEDMAAVTDGKKLPPMDRDGVVEAVKRFVPEAKVLSTAGGEVQMQLPLSSVSEFAEMFAYLEAESAGMGVGAYGIGMTTLEEVFMKFSTLRLDGTEQELEGGMEIDNEGNPTAAAAGGGLGGGRPLISDRISFEDLTEEKSGAVAALSPGVRPVSLSVNEGNGARIALNSSSEDYAGEDGHHGRYAPATFKEQVWELFRKRYVCAKRDLNGRLFEVVLPVLVVALVLAILKLNINPAGPSLDLSPHLYFESHGSGALSGGTADLPFNAHAWETLEPEALEILVNFRKNESIQLIPREDEHSLEMSEWLLETFNDHERHRWGGVVLQDTLFLNESAPTPSPITYLHNTTYFHAIPVLVNEVNQARFLANVANRRKLLGEDPSASPPGRAPASQQQQQQQWRRMRMMKGRANEIGLSAPSIHPATTAKEQQQQNIQNIQGHLNLRNHPLPLTKRENAAIQTFLTLFAALFVLIPFCYLPASFVIFVVRERSCKAKHLQMVSGVNPVAYWISTYLWDIANYLFVAVCCMVVFLLYGSDEFVGNAQVFFGTFYLILSYGLAAIPLSYCYSFLFDNHSSAQVGIAAIHFVCGFVLIVASFILDNVASTEDANSVLKNFYRLSPPYNLGEGLMQLSTQDLLKEWGHDVHPTWSWIVVGRNLFMLHLEAVGYFLLALAIEYEWFKTVKQRIRRALGYQDPEQKQKQQGDGGDSGPLLEGRGGAGKAVELRRPLLGLQEAAAEAKIDESGIPVSSHAVFDDFADEEEEDVRLERIRIKRMMQGQDSTAKENFMREHVLILDGLRKVYKTAKGGGKQKKRRSKDGVQDPRETPEGFVAVRNLSFAVPRGQCFALLGVNGCGKTSTMKSITGDHSPSAGDAFVAGYSVRTELGEVRQNLGYTPQFDPLLDLMTGREHLRMYARLRGVPKSRVEQVVESLIQTVALQKFADRVSSSYSGGNKRKLSLAIALIGSPSVVLLDEPSTGMDPVSKRFMWNVIAREVEDHQCAMVLTTHSMEEAEALCSRIAIMVAGRLTCLGSPQHLKSKYGKGYHLEINTKEARVPEVRDFVERTFPGAVLAEFHAGKLLYQLPQMEEISLSTIFGRVEKAKLELGIQDYALSQTSLEQIFVMKAKQHAREIEMDDE